MTSLALFLKAAFAFSAAGGAQGAVAIEHDPVGCVVAERFPRLEARLAPSDDVAKARILFQGETTHEWYAAQMKPEGDVFAGTLPKPLKSLKAFRYYIEVTDKAVGTSRTADFTTNVVASSRDCRSGFVAVALGSASVLLEGPAGLLAVPAGFASGGVVAAGSATGAAAATAATGAAAGGGGLSTGAVVGIAAGVGGAAAVGVARTRQGSEFDGVWTGTAQVVRTEPGVPPCNLGVDLSLELRESSGAVQGTMTAVLRAASPAGCDDVGGRMSGPVRGTARDSTVNFRWTTGESISPDFSGTRSGTSMSGTVTGNATDSSGEMITGTWRLSR